MKQLLHLAFTLFCLLSGYSLFAQGLYSSSPAITELYGVWTDGKQTIENHNAITAQTNTKYIADHLFKFKNIIMIHTEKLEFKGKVWYIWMIDYKMESSGGSGEYMTNFLALTETQNESLRALSGKSVSIVQIPCHCTMSMVRDWKEEMVIDGIKEAILTKGDISAITFCLTAKKSGDDILFNYDVDCWTYSGNISNRTYEKLDLLNNLDGGYFRIPVEQWSHLFFR